MTPDPTATLIVAIWMGFCLGLICGFLLHGVLKK